MSAPGYFNINLVRAHFNILPRVIKYLHTQYTSTISKCQQGENVPCWTAFCVTPNFSILKIFLLILKKDTPTLLSINVKPAIGNFLRLVDRRYRQCQSSAIIVSPLITQNPVLSCKVCFKVLTQQNGLTKHLSCRGITIKRR